MCAEGVSSQGIVHKHHFKHGFPAESAKELKTYFSYYGADVPVGNRLKSVFNSYLSAKDRIRFRKAVC